jgi:hypothetical protein
VTILPKIGQTLQKKMAENLAKICQKFVKISARNSKRPEKMMMMMMKKKIGGS